MQTKAKSKKKEIFAAQSSVLTNLSELVEKRNDIINQFTKGNIITKNEKFFDAPKKITERVTEQEFCLLLFETNNLDS